MLNLDMSQIRTCTICQVTKDLESGFYRGNKARKGVAGFYAQCKECVKISKRKPRICLGCGETYFHAGSAGAKRRACDKCMERGRVCRGCDTYKLDERFYAGRGGRRNGLCKDGCALAANRTTLYGVTQEQLAALHEKTGGTCEICKRTGRRMAVDHDHDTGKVRSLICSSCNSGLGLFSDNPEFLRGAIAYLEHHADLVA